MLQLLSFPVLVSGDRIIMREGLFSIIETCSGLRSIETLALLAILMIDLFGRRGLHAWLLLLASPFVAFLINGLRCLGLIFNPHADIASIHNLQGIAMLLGGVLLLYFLDGALARWIAEPAPLSELERRARAAAVGARTARAACGRAGRVQRAARRALAGCRASRRRPSPRIHRSRSSARSSTGGRASAQETDWMFLGKVGFGQIVNRHYTRGPRGGRPVHRPGRREQPDAQLPLAQGGLSRKRLDRRARGAHRDRGPQRDAGRARKGSARVLVAHWFEDSPGLAAESARALLSLDTTAWTRDRIPLAVRLATPLASSQERALESGRARLERFAERVCSGPADLVIPSGGLIRWETVFSIVRIWERQFRWRDQEPRQRVV